MPATHVEMVDPLTGEIEWTGSIAEHRAANAEDEATLEALDAIERGEITSELIGFYTLRAVQS